MLKFMYITNNPLIAKIATKSGVDWIFIDLEKNGKELRQKNLNTVKSNHILNDITIIKNAITKGEIPVRVNPIYEGSEFEINQAIDNGADILMLPYFKKIEEVEKFVEIINNRTKICLLLETKEAVLILDQITKLSSIDYIHIGLNDLSLSMSKKHMMELLVDGTLNGIIEKLKKTTISYGFGGLATLNKGKIPGKYILGEHVRYASHMTILSRSFYNETSHMPITALEKYFSSNIRKIRKFEQILHKKCPIFFKKNYQKIEKKLNNILKENN